MKILAVLSLITVAFGLLLDCADTATKEFHLNFNISHFVTKIGIMVFLNLVAFWLAMHWPS